MAITELIFLPKMVINEDLKFNWKESVGIFFMQCLQLSF